MSAHLACDGGLAGRGFRHDLDFRTCQQGLCAGANHYLVVGDEKGGL
jgi:hypothetical protein